MRTAEQEAHIIVQVREKVHQFFDGMTVPAHGIEHVSRVAKYAKRIAAGENARSPFLCELAGLLHDIGRVPEHFDGKAGGHHNLSYELLQEWFRDGFLPELTDDEKMELLYSVKYHWNNMANEYDTAWILRDADKLDTFGAFGLQRMLEYYGDDEAGINQDLRNHFDIYYWIKTDTAKQMMEEGDMLAPILDYYKEFIISKIEPVSL